MGVDNEIALYIIQTHFNTYYTGITNSIIRRWNEHVNNKSSYLSKYKAKEIVYIKFYNTRREAAKEERKVKNTGAKKYMLIQQFKPN
jgi:predicted GIY-YIG superfamily endonuclease